MLDSVLVHALFRLPNAGTYRTLHNSSNGTNTVLRPGESREGEGRKKNCWSFCCSRSNTLLFHVASLFVVFRSGNLMIPAANAAYRHSCGCFYWALPRFLLCCFVSDETQIWLGDLRVVLCGAVCFLFGCLLCMWIAALYMATVLCTECVLVTLSFESPMREHTVLCTIRSLAQALCYDLARAEKAKDGKKNTVLCTESFCFYASTSVRTEPRATSAKLEGKKQIVFFVAFYRGYCSV